jgi:6-phosphogluconolactonase
MKRMLLIALSAALAAIANVAAIAFIAAVAASFSGMDSKATAMNSADLIMYIGTYTRPPSKGIYSCRFDPATGRLTQFALAAETDDPSFLAVHPSQRFLYAANETSNYHGESAGCISAFAIDNASGRLKLLNQVSSKGAGPCHVSVDKGGKWVFAANYDSGSAAAFPVHPDGSLGEASAFVQHQGSSVNRDRQSSPHAHAATPAPDNRFLLVADLGLDRILSYHMGSAGQGFAAGKPRSAALAPGSGPRHLAFTPDGRTVYVINEMLSTVTAFSYDATSGALTELQTVSILPAGFAGSNSTAEIAVHPGGKYLYCSNRGDDSIAIFGIDQEKGTLTAAGHASTLGHTPRSFAIDPTGQYLVAANQESASVVVFRIDTSTGGLTPTGTRIEVPFPVCVVFAAGRIP